MSGGITDDLIGRAEAQTAIQFAARRYTVAHEAHGEGQVVWSDNLINVTDAMNVLRDLPSAQPERKRGIWTKDASCPFCGFQPWYEKDIHTLSFCPHCGADLRGERDE